MRYARNKILFFVLFVMTLIPAGAFAAVPNGRSVVYVGSNDRTIYIEYRLTDTLFAPARAFTILGVNYIPTEIGDTEANVVARYEAEANSPRDLPLIKAMGANTIRLLVPPNRTAQGLKFLDRCYENGLMVIMLIHTNYGGTTYVDTVTYFRDHPAILAWGIGEEYDRNNLYFYDNATFDQVSTNVNLVAAHIRQPSGLDAYHPTVVGWGDPSTFELLMGRLGEYIDIVSFNIYRGTNITDIFNNYKIISRKPMFISRYGTDSFDTRYGRAVENEEEQEIGVVAMTKGILDNLVTRYAEGVVSGGVVFEFSDQWWRYSGGSFSTQDTNYYDILEGVYPDNTLHLEWHGLVKIDRTPKRAYTGLQTLFEEFMKDEYLDIVTPLYMKAGAHEVFLNSRYVLETPTLNITDNESVTNVLPLSFVANTQYKTTITITDAMKNGEWMYTAGSTIEMNFRERTKTIIVDTVKPDPPQLSGKVQPSGPIYLSWEEPSDHNGSGIAYYELYREGRATRLRQTTTRNHTDKEVSGSGTTNIYRYRIQAFDNAGNASDWAYVDVIPKDEHIVVENRIIREGDQVTITGAFPNGGIFKVEIFDARGNKVRTLGGGKNRYEPGIHYDYWDGRDERGRFLPPGLYYIKINVANEKKATEKVFIQ